MHTSPSTSHRPPENGLLATLARHVLRHPVLFSAFILAIVLCSLVGASRVRFEFNWLSFFAGEDAGIEHYQEFVDSWGSDDDIALVVVKTDEGTLLSTSRLDEIQRLVDTLRQDPGVSRVDSVTTVPAVPDSESSTGLLRSLGDLSAEGIGGGTEEEETRHADLVTNPLLVPTLLSADGRVAAVIVKLKASSDLQEGIAPTIDRLQALLKERNGRKGLHYGLTGTPIIREVGIQTMISDQLRLVPCALIVIVLTLFILFRRVQDVLIPLIVACLPTLMLFGLLGYVAKPIGILNQAYFTLIPILAVADAIHFLTRYRDRIARSQGGPYQNRKATTAAIIHIMSRVGIACFVTSVTTGVGFLSLLGTKTPALRDFGLYAAIGIAFAFGTMLIAVPLLFALFRVNPHTVGSSDKPSASTTLLDWLAGLALKRSWLILCVTGLVVMASVFGGLDVRVGNNPTRMVLPEHPTAQAAHLVDEHLGGLLNLQIDLRGQPGAFHEPQILSALYSLEARLRRFPGVKAVNGPATRFAMVNAAITGQRGLPESRAAIDEIMILAKKDDRFSGVLRSQSSEARIIIGVGETHGQELIQLSTQVQLILNRAVANLPVNAQLTGNALIAARGVNDVTRDFRLSLIIALAVISIFLGLMLRSIRLLLLCLLPNLLPLLVGYGVLGWLNWSLDPMSGMIFVVALGIAVDDTVHFIVCFQQLREQGHNFENTLRRTVLYIGKPVMITTLLLVEGFAITALSTFEGLMHIAVLGIVILSTACLSDLFVLPALLVLFGKRVNKPAQ